MNELPAEVIEKLALLPPMSKKVDQIHLAMYGNGNPERGVMMRLTVLESVRRGWITVVKWAAGVGTAVLLLLVGRWIG